MDDGNWSQPRVDVNVDHRSTKEGDVVGPPLTWEELDPMVRKIKIEEESLRRMLKGLKTQVPNHNSEILIRLIEQELSDPRLS